MPTELVIASGRSPFSVFKLALLLCGIDRLEHVYIFYQKNKNKCVCIVVAFGVSNVKIDANDMHM